MQKRTAQLLRYGAIGLVGVAAVTAIVSVNRPVRLPEATTPLLTGAAPQSPAPAAPAAPAAATNPTSPTAPTAPAADAPDVNPAAFHGQGKLAFIWHDLLYALDGDSNQVRQLSTSGKAAHPLWSSDGQWVAYVRVTDPQAMNGSLWLVRQDGTGAHEVQGLPGALNPRSFAWSPTANQLVVSRQGLWVVPVDGAPRQLDSNAGITTAAFSPDGKTIAYNSTLPYTDPSSRDDALMTIPAVGGKATQISVVKQAGVQVARWWPDGQGVLYWVDPLHSGSLAADGMALMSQPLADTQAKPLSGGLGNLDWLTWSSQGELAVVKGGGRISWSGKSLAVCDAKAGVCRDLTSPAGSVATEPDWSPDGNQLAFVAAKDLGPEVGGLKPDQLQAWVASHTLWVENADGTQAHALLDAGAGVYDPAWSQDGKHILYVRDNGLWLISSGGGQPQKVLGSPMEAKDIFGFYGYLSYRDTFAWLRR